MRSRLGSTPPMTDCPALIGRHLPAGGARVALQHDDLGGLVAALADPGIGQQGRHRHADDAGADHGDLAQRPLEIVGARETQWHAALLMAPADSSGTRRRAPSMNWRCHNSSCSRPHSTRLNAASWSSSRSTTAGSNSPRSRVRCESRTSLKKSRAAAPRPVLQRHREAHLVPALQHARAAARHAIAALNRYFISPPLNLMAGGTLRDAGPRCGSPAAARATRATPPC